MNNNLTYQKTGDYLIPDLKMSTEELPATVGKYGMLRETYLKEHRKGTYTRKIMQDTLWAHIVEVDQIAQAEVDRLIDEMMITLGVTEELKANDQMKWVQMVMNIKAQAEEFVLNELIYC